MRWRLTALASGVLITLAACGAGSPLSTRLGRPGYAAALLLDRAGRAVARIGSPGVNRVLAGDDQRSHGVAGSALLATQETALEAKRVMFRRACDGIRTLGGEQARVSLRGCEDDVAELGVVARGIRCEQARSTPTRALITRCSLRALRADAETYARAGLAAHSLAATIASGPCQHRALMEARIDDLRVEVERGYARILACRPRMRTRCEADGIAPLEAEGAQLSRETAVYGASFPLVVCAPKSD